MGPPSPVARAEAARHPCAAGAAYAPACPTCCHPHSAPRLAEPPVWRHLPCDCRHGIGSSLRYNRGRLAQSLDYLPNAHGADFDAPQQPGPLRRQRVRRPYRQQGPQARQRTADAPRFHTQQIQQRPAFVFTGWAPIAGYGGVQAAPARHPGYCLGVMPLHGLTAPHMWATGSGASRPRHSPCLARLSACGHGTGPPLPVPATCTARLPAKPDAAGPPRVVRPAYAADAVWPRATCFPRAGRHHKPGLHHGASRTHGAVQPALDKTENSITVLGRNVQQNRHPGIPESAASMMAMLRYGSRFPWNRLESLENSLGIPLPAATQCQIMAETAVLLQPALDELQRQAAQGEVCSRCAPWLSGRHFGPLSTLRNAEVPIPKSGGDRTVPPFLDPHEGASQSGADVLARDLVDLRIQRERVIVVHPALFHMAENRRQIVMLLQRPVGIVCAAGATASVLFTQGRNSLSR